MVSHAADSWAANYRPFFWLESGMGYRIRYFRDGKYLEDCHWDKSLSEIRMAAAEWLERRIFIRVRIRRR